MTDLSSSEKPEWELWRDKLWESCEAQAARLTGGDAIYCLHQISDEIWEAGLDDTFISFTSDTGDREINSHLFDIGWLTVLLVRLNTVAERTEAMELEKQKHRKTLRGKVRPNV